MRRIAILGTGMAGFGAAHAAHAAGVRPVMYDMHDHIGGHTASYEFPGGWTFDEGPHVSFTDNTRVQDLLAANVEGKYEAFATKVNNYWKGHWIKHPAQINLHGLPPDLVTKIMMEFVEISQRTEEPTIRNYEDWLRASFGNTFSETFPMEYTVKYHTTTAANMNTEWIGPRLYRPKLEEVFRGALQPKSDDVHYIAGFRYPTHGGFVSYLHPFRKIADIQLDHRVVKIDPKERVIYFANGAKADYDGVVSSIPLPELVPMIAGAPRDVVEAAERLACSEAVIVNLGVDRADLVDAHWSYFYDRDICFARLSTPHLQSPNNVPPGCGSLQAECYYSKKYRPLNQRPEDCIEPVIADLKRCGVLRETDKILFRQAMHIPYANVIFDLESMPATKLVHGYLEDIGIGYCGRYGDWAYIWTDQSFVSGENALQKVLSKV
ncbi:MAG: NAD(P)-binding protein [Hyphomicrobium sp.]|uniref:protoporphyrinogen/coproporphyrinogen oxidase n=1 Tax=Hyphomicrobium sp. TaxID=82 RepID=UPI00356A8192